MTAFDAYIICATPRTGSTLLCDLLASTGEAGAPDSFFSRRFIPWWADQWGLSMAKALGEPEFSKAYLAAAIRAGKGATSLFGLRLMRESVDDLNALIDRVDPGLPPGKARLESAFGRICYIHLFRDDKVAQAVSLVKAEQTGLWHVAPDGSELERLGPPTEPIYDFARLHQQVLELDADDKRWMQWFALQEVEPLTVNYERLALDPAETLVRICTALGVLAPPGRQVIPQVAKMSDSLSRGWATRYKSDRARLIG